MTVTVQLRSFRSHYFYCLSQTVLDLEDSLDLKTEKPVSKCFQYTHLKVVISITIFAQNEILLKCLMPGISQFPNGIEDDWETHHSFAI